MGQYSVSYTHLDVYKRQKSDTFELLIDVPGVKNEYHNYPKDRVVLLFPKTLPIRISDKFLSNFRYKIQTRPVSYTHLHPQISLVYNPVNNGFTGGNNLGVEHAKGDYVILLNNDCIVSPQWIEELVATAESDKNIFAVNSKILLFPKFFPLNIKTDLGYIDAEAIMEESRLSIFTRKDIRALHTFDDNQMFTIHIPTHPTQEDSIIKVAVHKMCIRDRTCPT